MAKKSFRDPVTGDLKSWGYTERNEPGDIAQEEPDDFSLDTMTKKWRWDGQRWNDVTPIPPTLVDEAKALYFAKTPAAALDRASTLAILDELNELRAFVSLPARTPEEIAQKVQTKITPDEVTPAEPAVGLIAKIKSLFRG